jgi:hypothetical protein
MCRACGMNEGEVEKPEGKEDIGRWIILRWMV